MQSCNRCLCGTYGRGKYFRTMAQGFFRTSAGVKRTLNTVTRVQKIFQTSSVHSCKKCCTRLRCIHVNKIEHTSIQQCRARRCFIFTHVLLRFCCPVHYYRNLLYIAIFAQVFCNSILRTNKASHEAAP